MKFMNSTTTNINNYKQTKTNRDLKISQLNNWLFKCEGLILRTYNENQKMEGVKGEEHINITRKKISAERNHS